MMDRVKVSLIIPCLNEEETIGSCIKKAKEVFLQRNIKAEIIVVDNGSTDSSVKIALNSGAKVIRQPMKGYGAAYLKGLEEAGGEYLIMGDGDDTYDFKEIPKLIEALDEGYDLVIGSRFKGKILKGAMSLSHRYIGNPVLTGILNMFFGARISDAHSGLRAITRGAVSKLDLKTTGMEFASEMVVASLREKLKITEVPITYYHRKGESKLHSFPDAWRHVRFMLLFSPDWLFLTPGLILFLGGFISFTLSALGVFTLFGHRFDIHSMIFFAFFSLVGFQIINLGFIAKRYSIAEGFKKDTGRWKIFYRKFSLERGVFFGAVCFSVGFLASAYIFWKWVRSGFGPLNEAKLAVSGLLFMVLGVQTIFSSFFISLFELPKRRKKDI
jgi:glycosyltransferase involved in cell wall biosynthesis